eukprot:TRINITY_DN1099_c0_g1_i2.p1 TRINITY_DN1099_c0_g1~~TRINITY_DN1099_c0_g1_i2.p1  ORF type:complete len:176 (-),score=41.85 TRINITY_DN1099_c0_g1_i2:117-644(-)
MCIRDSRKSVKAGDLVHGMFMISGEDEESIDIKIKEIPGPMLLVEQGVREKDFSFRIERDVKVEVCFRSTMSKESVITFDFQSQLENEHLEIKPETLGPVSKEFAEARRNLIDILIDVDGQQVREQAHRNILKQTEDRIKFASAIKLLIVIMLTVAQVSIVTRLIRSNEVQVTSA